MTATQVEDSKRRLDAALAALAEVKGDVPPSPPPAAAARPDALAALTRLLIGAALLGADELERRAPEWERQARAFYTPPDEAAAPAPPPANPEIRHALIGWIFTTEDRLRLTPDPGEWLRAAGSHAVATTAALIRESIGGLSPRRGRPAAPNPELAAWLARGAEEEQHSRAFARVALQDLTQGIIERLANEPAVQELVQQQSTTLAGEVLEEVRERTVSGDVYLDSFVRRLLRRPPPADLPPPPAVAAIDSAGALPALPPEAQP